MGPGVVTISYFFLNLLNIKMAATVYHVLMKGKLIARIFFRSNQLHQYPLFWNNLIILNAEQIGSKTASYLAQLQNGTNELL